MSSIDELKILNAQYKELRKSELVYRIELKAVNGTHGIGNKKIINKVIDLLIHESQKQIEKEVSD